MNEQSIHAIEAIYSERADELLRSWYEARSEIARTPETVEGPHAELLTDAQRAEASYQQKAERARAKAEGYRQEYLELTRERNDAIQRRAKALHKEVYTMESAEVLTRAALATDAQLGAMMELAATTGALGLGRAVFAVAEQRQLGEIMSRYFDVAGQSAREAYEELKAAPSEESMERKLADADKLFPAPTPADFAPILGVA